MNKKVCAACGKAILGKVVSIKGSDKFHHPECVTCDFCGEKLEG